MSQQYSIIIQPEAQRGIEAAYFWYSNYSPKTARRWLEGLYQKIMSLQQMPFRCSLAFENDLVEAEIRQLVYGKGSKAYRILFTVVEEQVNVLFIRHIAQKPLSYVEDEEE
jgi:plasmid stabilization system protein ParE